MKASELRLGNLVSNMNPRHNDRILTIESIGDNHEVNVFYRKYLLSELEPIPLTEEWFLKFGFKKVGTNFELDFFVLWYSSYQNCFVWRFMNIDSNADRPISLKYVHQLQNLYFALTGEELTLNQDL